MFEIISSFLDSQIEFFKNFGYIIAFMAALGETVAVAGFFVPGSTLILILGAFSAKGYLNIIVLLILACLGAIIGDNINFHWGKKYGTSWMRKGVFFIKPWHFEEAKKFFKNHSRKSVFLGRFVPNIKEIMPIIAGAMGMKRLVFTLYNAAGAIGWAVGWSLTGYFFAQSLISVNFWINKVEIFVIISLASTAIIILLKQIFQIKKISFWKKIFKKN